MKALAEGLRALVERGMSKPAGQPKSSQGFGKCSKAVTPPLRLCSSVLQCLPCQPVWIMQHNYICRQGSGGMGQCHAPATFLTRRPAVPSCSGEPCWLAAFE